MTAATRVVIPVTGMTCAACEARVQRTLSKTPGVVGASVNLMMGNATGSQSAAIQGVQMGSFLLSLLLSGYLFAVSNIPVQIRWFSNVLPATHYIQIVRNSILRNVGWDTSFWPLVYLAILAFAFFTLNVVQMRKMQFKA